MAEHFSFFDAVLEADGVTYDREYNAQQFTDYFKTLVTTGVMKSAFNMLAVNANGSDMVTSVNTGIAFIEGRYYFNDSPLQLTHDTETLGNSRMDRVVIRLDLRTEARYVKTFIKKGVPSTNPVAPTLTQMPNLYEISLAQVKIVGGQTFIAANAVIDERGTDVVCPWAGSNILPSFDDNALAQHIADTLVHVQPGERANWNGKKPLKSTGAMTADPNTVQDPTFLCRHSNMGDGGANYWYVEQTWYDQTNNRMQQATSYAGDQPIFKIRHCYGGIWSPWSNASPYIVVGQNATVTGWAGTAIGPNAKATNNGTAIGVNCEAYDGSIAVGRGVKAYTGSDGQVSAGFGVSSDVSNGGFVLGNGAVGNNKGIGVLGGASNVGSTTYHWNIPGSLSVSGQKNFEIPHPHPDKKYTHVIRHGAVESPTAGDTLYRYKIEATTDGETVEVQLPDYFEYLNTDIDVWVNPDEHFGRAFGKVIGDKLLVTCEKAGAYKALVIGTRNDDNVQDWHIKGVEREVGESWLGETFVIEVDEITEATEFEEVL